MFIQMTQTRRASADGFAVRCFYKGLRYDVADTLARSFINAGWAITTISYHDSILRISPMTYNRLLARTSAPAAEPLTLSETKLYLRIDHDIEDTLIGDLIVSARMSAESWLRRSLINQSWKLGYDECAPMQVDLPMGPVGSVTSVNIIDRNNSTTTLDEECYSLNSAKNMLRFDSPVYGFHVEITYNTGYGAAPGNVPSPIRQGMLGHIAAMYDNRGEYNIAMPEQTYALYLPFREILL